MAQPYIGEIRMFGGSFAPQSWAFCDGQLQSIAQNNALFSLLGTTYGGDGQTTFALPDLRGRFPLHQGTGGGATYAMGQVAGVETVTLTVQQIPAHTHTPMANSGAGNQASPAGNVWAASALGQFSSSAPGVAMNANALTNSGGSQPHDNMPPYLVITFIIALFGVFPSQN